MRKLLIWPLVFIWVLIPVCGDSADLKTKAEVEAMLRDFSIKLTLDAEGQETYYFTQVVCDDGCYNELEGRNHEIEFADFTANQLYTLDVDEKIYVVEPLDPEMRDELRGFDFMLGSNLFLHTRSMNNNAFKKAGNEKILGRDATVYALENNNGTTETFWIDDEYGFTLKYIQTGGHQIRMEVTEFGTKGISVAGMLNLDGYQLEEED